MIAAMRPRIVCSVLAFAYDGGAGEAICRALAREASEPMSARAASVLRKYRRIVPLIRLPLGEYLMGSVREIALSVLHGDFMKMGI